MILNIEKSSLIFLLHLASERVKVKRLIAKCKEPYYAHYQLQHNRTKFRFAFLRRNLPQFRAF